MSLSSVLAKLVPGFGVASGKCRDARFPSGTIAMQLPYFEQFGLKLKGYYQGTLNLDISPYDFELLNPDYSFNSVKWSTDLPAENFSFFSCRLKKANAYSNSSYNGFVYWPHPSTKPEFHQNLSVLEVVAPFIPNLSYGSMLELTTSSKIIRFTKF